MSKLWQPDNAGKVIPVVRVRPLVPPAPHFHSRLQPQHMHWQLGHYVEDLSFGPGGRGRRKRWVVDKEAEQHNLILTQTYDVLMFGTGGIGWMDLARYAVVGTGSTPPDPSQTGLVSEVSRTIVDQYGNNNGTRTLTRLANGVYKISVVREFTEAQVGNRNLTEWGFSPSGTAGGNLMCRELFRDGNGNPIVITPASDQRLRLIYAFSLTFSPLQTPASITIDGLGTFTGTAYVRGGNSNSTETSDAQLLQRFTANSANSIYVALLAASYTGAYFGTTSSAASVYLPSNGLNNITRGRTTVPVTFAANQGNTTIYGLAIGVYGEGIGFLLTFGSGQSFTKTDQYKLTIGPWTVTWGP
ncbi:hypothetical protein [Thermus tengchongensis]|uniref:Uncharacterized protein n=1 Tax=Thermus tengchongensis TaxID=1214928 RepID=A0ABY2K3Q2_9DEIN|nr:hypothetical protein [Thermus tengchongensis]TFU14667.1 hypothetical protein E0489_11630 [Thermus tengchongensis]